MTDPAAAQGWIEKLLQSARDPWQAVLLVGQMVFFSRFAVQWWASERQKRVVIPVAFWWLSLGGAAMSLLAFVCMERPQPVMILAQTCGLAIYARNLVLHRRTVGSPAGAP